MEFALVLPFLLVILFAILEYGWLFTNRIVLFNAVGDAARAAVKARDWEGEDPAEFAGEAFKTALWITDADRIAVLANTGIGSVSPGEVALSVVLDDAAPRSVSVVAVMGYRSLTGFLPQNNTETEQHSALLPATIAAKAAMVFP